MQEQAEPIDAVDQGGEPDLAMQRRKKKDQKVFGNPINPNDKSGGGDKQKLNTTAHFGSMMKRPQKVSIFDKLVIDP